MKKHNRTNILIGQMVKAKREDLCISAETLAEKARIKIQQLEKYEQGKSIPAALLYDFADILEIPVDDFFILDDQYSKVKKSKLRRIELQAREVSQSYISIKDPQAQAEAYYYIRNLSLKFSGSQPQSI